ncbi:uncharacterized protein TNCV_3216101 [Trichonephila clavipes]|nr:uncharacterized protein TNCV_3216101 [Trichonephila clavipes]
MMSLNNLSSSNDADSSKPENQAETESNVYNPSVPPDDRVVYDPNAPPVKKEDNASSCKSLRGDEKMMVKKAQRVVHHLDHSESTVRGCCWDQWTRERSVIRQPGLPGAIFKLDNASPHTARTGITLVIVVLEKPTIDILHIDTPVKQTPMIIALLAHYTGGKKNSAKGAGKKPKKGDNEIMSKSKLRKLLRNTGQEYVTKKGKVVKAKVFENKDCGCSKRCVTKVAVEDRQKCFDKFWKMGDFGKQNAYLSGLVTREAVKQHRPRLNCTNRGPKGVTYQYRVNVGRVSKQVCKKYFLQTFLVSDGRLSRALRKEENEKEPGEDLRGKKPPANKTSEEQLNRVRSHISKFPRYDCHYAINPKGKYLKSDLNVKKMYGMYVEQCKEKEVPYVKENIYRSVFNEEFSYTFLSPRKDPCHLLLNPRKSQTAAPRKKVIKPQNNMEVEGLRQPPQPMPQHQKFPVAPQLFCPTDNLKCAYNHLNAPPTHMIQEKNTHYPQCEEAMAHSYFPQDHNINHHNYPSQTPSFFNL